MYCGTEIQTDTYTEVQRCRLIYVLRYSGAG